MNMNDDTPAEVSAYMARIGAMGGAAGKGRPKAGLTPERARRMAQARWRPARKRKSKATI